MARTYLGAVGWEAARLSIVSSMSIYRRRVVAAFGVIALSVSFTACTASTVVESPSALPPSPAPTSTLTRGEKIEAAYRIAKPKSDAARAKAQAKADAEWADIVNNGKFPDEYHHPKCERVAYVEISRASGAAPGKPWDVEMHGGPVDVGTDIGARGQVTLDAEGTPVSYTIASGDRMLEIGGRFCWDYISLSQLNSLDAEDIYEGQRLMLVPEFDTMELPEVPE